MDFRQGALPELVVVDDFLTDPEGVRDLALGCLYHEDLRWFKGRRSTERHLWPYLREEFGRLLGTPVSRWTEYDANGVFQLTTADDELVYHSDNQDYAAAIYLNPHTESGTSFWRDPENRARRGRDSVTMASDPACYTDRDSWQFVETVAGVYNRLVIWDASLIHSAESYSAFEASNELGRLVQLFFFDVTY